MPIYTFERYEKKFLVSAEQEKRLTAYHEAGHAIATHFCPTQDPVHQISIIPRGMAAGYIAVRRGLNNYLGWLAPPLMEVLGNALVWGYPPSAGPVFVCAFVSLVGAATGEVRNRQGSNE